MYGSQVYIRALRKKEGAAKISGKINLAENCRGCNWISLVPWMEAFIIINGQKFI